MPRTATHGTILNVTGVNSSVAGVYSDVLENAEGSHHFPIIDITLNDVVALEVWPEVSLNGTNWKKLYACDKSQILWSFTADYSGAIQAGYPSSNASMNSLPFLGHIVRWGVKPTTTVTTGASVTMSLELWSKNHRGHRWG